MIKIKHFQKYFHRHKANEIHAINDTSLVFPDTGLVCILGESGCGKTTLINVMGGLDSFDGGSLEVDGQVLTKYRPRKIDEIRHRQFGYIFQNYYLLQDRSVYYNIELALTMYDLSPQAKEERIDYVLRSVGMYKYRKRLVSQLSGGQQQRVAIARALAKTPKVIFADEPTGNLDEKNTIQIMNILKTVAKECLIILVTHERRIAEFYADRILAISDGKIVNDSTAEGDMVYQYADDTRLYLRDYHENKESFEGITLRYFAHEACPAIELKIVYDQGKIYLQAESDAKIEFIDPNGEKQMIDAARPSISKEEIEHFDYHLERLETKKRPHLSLKETWRLALTNFRAMGKKRIFMFVSLLAMAVLTMLAVEDVSALVYVNKRAVVSVDSHHVSVNTSRESISLETYNAKISELVDVLYYQDEEILPANIIPMRVGEFYLTYDALPQFQDLRLPLRQFSLVDATHLRQSDLLYGRLPETYHEVVVDRWLIENLINQNSVISSIYSTVPQYLNKTLHTTIKNKDFTIVGIADTDEPTIYADRFVQLLIATQGDSIGTLSDLQQRYPGQYDDVVLESSQALASARTISEGSGSTSYTTSYGSRFLLNTNYVFPDEFGANVVIDDRFFDEEVKKLITSNRKWEFYTEDKAQVVNLMNTIVADERFDGVQVVTEDAAQAQIKVYQDENGARLDARMIVTITIVAITVLMLYFTMKSNAIKRIYDLGVYRSLGISKGSIILAFFFELLIISCCTTLVATTLTYLVVQLLVSIPSLAISFSIAPVFYFATTGGLFAINIMIGLLPIFGLLRLPPARLTSKYDM